MKARPSNLIPFAPFDGLPPLHKLDQKMMKELRNLADRTGCTVERCIREGFADFVTRHAAEEELEAKIIDFRATHLWDSATQGQARLWSRSDALSFGHLWYLEVGAAIAYAKFYSRSHDAVIHVYDETGKLIEVHRHRGDFKEPWCMDIEEVAQQIRDEWNNKTLTEFRIEAERESTGMVYESFGVDTGQRLVLMLCLTDIEQIQTLERCFELKDDGTQEDWNTLTLGEVFRRTVVGSGIAFESLHDEYGRRAAFVICAAEPQSIERLYSTFNL